MSKIIILPTVGLLLSLGNVPAAEPAAKANPVISRCDQPFMFGFGSWEKAKSAFPAKADGIHISARNCQGGAGIAGLSVPVGNYGDWSPTLTLAVTEQNQAAALICIRGRRRENEGRECDGNVRVRPLVGILDAAVRPEDKAVELLSQRVAPAQVPLADAGKSRCARIRHNRLGLARV